MAMAKSRGLVLSIMRHIVETVPSNPCLTHACTQVRVQAGSSAQELPGPEVGQFYDGCAYTIVHSYSTGMGEPPITRNKSTSKTKAGDHA